jgi:hypothetical protein
VADGVVLAGLLTAGATAMAGVGTTAGVFLSRKSAREAAKSAAQASGDAQALEERKLGYELMRVSIDVARQDIDRLTKERELDRKELQKLRADMRACDDERRDLVAQVERFTNGA